jgi:alpha-galactosidase
MMNKNNVRLLLLLLILLVNGVANAQQQIVVETGRTSLVFTVGENGKLYQSYFGSKLSAPSLQTLPGKDLVESYIPAGTDNLFEPAIRIVHADGNPALAFKFLDSKVSRPDANNTVTSITLKDPLYPVTVVLHISAFYKEDVLKSWTEIRHQEKKPVRLTNFASSMLHFSAGSYWLTQFHGDWAEEVRMEESQLTSGIKVIDSKLGSRAHMYQTPAFFLSLNNKATENEGELIAGTLAWSGNFQFLFELDEKNRMRIVSGMNPYASDYLLEPGKPFITPEFIFTWANKGKGQASRSLHSWARNYGVLNGKGERLTLLNNWEATEFNFDEQKLSALFGEAKKLGVDLFLLDDGWFANKYPRNDDHAGLGDWEENRKKIPNGIGHLVKDANSQGVQFGIWLEPEMVNPKSELYEKHPDWILKLPGREEHYFRNQLVLDLVNPQVQQFVYQTVDDLLTKNPGIAYIKWDCNRMMSNTYSPYLKENQSNVYIEYVRSLYAVLEKLREKYPTLPMMLCSGGGGRTDYGGLKYFTEFWPSDNTDPWERVFIQWGYSYFFPSLTLSSHITSWGKQPLKFKTDVAMMGRLGYDLNVSHLSENDLRFSQQAVKEYKRLSTIIWQGDQYRLIAPYQSERAALMYVNEQKTKAVLFAYTLHAHYGTDWLPVQLEGLDATKKYTVREINLYPGSNAQLPEQDKQFTGEYLMKIGLNASKREALTSSVIEITAAE